MQGKVFALIAREGGADLQELMDATGASIASVRSTVSMLKQAGKAVVRDRGTRRYSVAA